MIDCSIFSCLSRRPGAGEEGSGWALALHLYAPSKHRLEVEQALNFAHYFHITECTGELNPIQPACKSRVISSNRITTTPLYMADGICIPMLY